MSDQTDHIAHHEGYNKSLELALSICLCYTLCVLTLRLYVRWRAFGIDDFVVSLSAILALVFFGCGYASSTTGLGRSMKVLSSKQDTVDLLNVLALVSNLSWITALCLSKLAIISLLLRTSQTRSHQRLQYFVAALVSTQCILSIILMTAGCTTFDGLSWDFKQNASSCPRQVLRWQVITGFDIATEVAILALPVQLVWKLQMPTKNKLIVITAFWLRIPTLVLTVLRNNSTYTLTSTTDVSLTAAMVVIWQAIELSYSIAAATIAALKRFTESLNTGFGHGELMRVHGHSQGYKMSARSTSIKGSTVSKPSISVEPVGRQEEFQQLKLGPENVRNQVTVSSVPEREGLGEGAGKGRCKGDDGIRHDVRYSIHYDEEPLVS